MTEQTKSSSSLSLRIAVVGVGGIGSAFAFQLLRLGHHEVTVVARPGSPRLQQLMRDQGIVDVHGERADVRVTDALDEHESYDLVIVTVLAHQVDVLLPSLKRSAAKGILFMFNNFNPERLRDAIGADRCAFGMPFIQAWLDANGKLKAAIGAQGQKSKINQQVWVDLFNDSGLPATLEPDMLLWLRCHAPLCIAFESVSVAAMRRGTGATWGEAIVLARGVKEGFALIERLGYKIYPSEKRLMNRSPAGVTAAMLWSVSRIRSFRELLATGAGECRALVDELMATAARANPPMAVNKIEKMKPPETMK